ncbi:MAG: guanylate kinase [Ignavibacteriaceae bacterium]|nr:guanylate kinase [Ignavibacteriaceae bacterium]
MKRGSIIVVSAPSGAGKTTIVKEILKEFPEIIFSVSATTRKKRETESDGIDYFFISEEKFKEHIKNNDFVEWEKFYDYYYGTFKSFIDSNIENGKSVLLELDVKGALSIKNIYPESSLIYILPPSLDELVDRLVKRKTENEDDLKKRIKRAEMELSLKNKFDYLVINKELDIAIDQAKSLIKKIIEGKNNEHRTN